jgi:hypothetical protein
VTEHFTPRVYSNPVTRPCDYCGGDFVANTPRNKYCCQQCAQRGWREKNSEHVREWQKRWWHSSKGPHSKKEPLVERQCGFCHKRFLPSIATQIYCNRTCRRQRAKRNYTVRPCDWCGTVFKPRQGEQIHCSRKCSKTYWRRKLAARRTKQVVVHRLCDYCGGKFAPHQGNRTQLYCQTSCLKRGWREKNSERAREADRRRYYANPERIRLRKRRERERREGQLECTHTANQKVFSLSDFKPTIVGQT